MHLSEITHEGQTEAEATVLASGAAIGLAEAIEEIRQKLRIHAYAIVADGDLNPVANARQTGFDAAAFVGELERV